MLYVYNKLCYLNIKYKKNIFNKKIKTNTKDKINTRDVGDVSDFSR